MNELPLAGFTVAVTATRRREELSALLRRRGARVTETPTIRIVAPEDDELLRASTESCLAQPPDVVVATSATGFGGWMDAADGWALGGALRARLAAAEALACGPEAGATVRAAGIAEAWSPDTDSPDAVLARLLARGVAGRRVAVQLHDEAAPGLVDALREAGATVTEVQVHRWVPAEDTRPLRRLIEQIVANQVDCVTFTSAPAVLGMLTVARDDGREAVLLAALRGDAVAACVGPLTAGPLERHDVPTVQPRHARLDALVQTVVDELPVRRTRAVLAGEHELRLRGHSVLVDGTSVELTARQAGVLSALVAGGGRVLSRAELLKQAWREEPADEHAVEMTVARLRTALGPAGKVVQTVVKRGYRLAAPAHPFNNALRES